MPGCQAIKQNGKHCRNYACKSKTCCYVHRYLEDMVAEVEELPVKKTIVKISRKCDMWGPPEQTIAEDGTIGEIQFMKSTWPWEPTTPSYSVSGSESDSDDPDYK